MGFCARDGDSPSAILVARQVFGCRRRSLFGASCTETRSGVSLPASEFGLKARFQGTADGSRLQVKAHDRYWRRGEKTLELGREGLHAISGRRPVRDLRSPESGADACSVRANLQERLARRRIRRPIASLRIR